MPTKKSKDLDAPLTQRDLIAVTDTIREVADFIITEIKKNTRSIAKVRKQAEINTKSLTQSIDDVRQQELVNKQSIEEIRKQGETNTQSLAQLTKQLNATEKLEFDIYNHEQRITKLEKVKS
ncbi:MAG: hypothetical protein A3C02_00275 [Candidatus Andersenbacteria bacterium RIFCSPHIGHO2_02_FULL_45_11]|uniref:Uncharacterized protein n=1 Tax=Candidatus Andersenbacteria bacterium RIFCSPHIGHO2_12_FULL_45_11 TaxID=1797281 RepID=A0A1G1X3Q2_9BACT|nr:MAG: hypothetical protein A2805_02185 [Candidatus Andersenbacteria bacterium RIFCSPHIGHO2_01_FULL_46_36]OGY33967.1 MAG: hypothetical protein A3D99_04075 [Candidatus Andersenbacteria bacterium RIFCSPHIGHO2_12_FULL_45_11]OGY34533.1 MAG: hypothetical protein A3C02_00275 [Candidatus Andersenbacteria bacterium RIFCSPHIGHO2_02_FULL_45_11]